MGRVKYSEFVDLLDVESLMADIGFEPLHQDNRGNYVGYCLWPEHHTNGDTTGKFAIHPDKKVYNCYVCGGGSLLSMMMELNGWDSETAENTCDSLLAMRGTITSS
jgi:DNA primase